MKCPRCERPVDLGAAICPACLADVSEVPSAPSRAPAPVAEPAAELVAPPTDGVPAGPLGLDANVARCPEHPDYPAAGACERCGKFFCIRCVPDALERTSARCPACRDREKTDGPRGIGGWLILPAIGLVLLPVRLVKVLLADLLPAFAPETIDALTNPSSPAYHPLYVPMVLFEVVVNCALLVFALFVLVRFFQKKRSVPRLMIVLYTVTLVIPLVDAGLVAAAGLPGVDWGTQVRETGRSLVVVWIWVPYFLTSKRVRNTFVVP